MPLQIRKELSAGVLLVEVTGAFDLADAKVSFREVLDDARERNLGKILVDFRSLTGEVSTMERFELGMFMSELRPAGIRMAFLGTTDFVWPDRFMETVAVNRGVNIKVCTEMAEATGWLERNPP